MHILFYSLTRREIARSPFLTLLNILVLAAGLAAGLLIFAFIYQECQYDTGWANRGRVVRINTTQQVGGGQTIRLPTASYPVAEGLASSLPMAENFVRFRMSPNAQPVRVDSRTFQEAHLLWAGPGFFNVFGHPLSQGDATTALAGKNRVVLAESTARRYFGTAAPVGREIVLSRDRVFTVTGVMPDLTGPSHLPSPPAILSLETLTIDAPEYWVGRSSYASYLLLKEGASLAEAQRLASSVYRQQAEELLKILHADCRITLQPLAEIHFDTGFDMMFDFQPAIAPGRLWSLGLAAVFILLNAVFGFSILVTARYAERAHQLAVLKSCGASRLQLTGYLLTEAVMLALPAFGLALLLAGLLQPLAGDLMGQALLDSLFHNPLLLLAAAGVALLAGVAAGLMPVPGFSRMPAASILQGRPGSGRPRSRARLAFIVIQSAVTVALISGTLIIQHQLRFMDSLDPGFKRDNLLVLRVPPGLTADKCQTFRSEALRMAGVEAGTLSVQLPSMGFMEYTYEVPGSQTGAMFMARQFMVDEHFIPALGLQLIEGRNFRPGSPAAGREEVIINETAARQLGWADPAGRQLDADPASGAENTRLVTIIGVVRDIHFESLHHAVEPMLLAPAAGRPEFITLRLDPGRPAESLVDAIRRCWQQVMPAAPFNPVFLQDHAATLYHAEARLGRLFSVFSVLAGIIAATGMLSLAIFQSERRGREIGIRKVLGATSNQLVAYLCREYVRLTAGAMLLAGPLVFWAAGWWLEGFVRRPPFPWWICLLAGLLTTGVVLAATASITWRLSRINPVKVLRRE